jgi:hypothetical protein
LRKEQIMIKVNGVAGVFLYANDPKGLAEWYALNFGIEFFTEITDTYYMEFYYRDDSDPSKRWSSSNPGKLLPAPSRSRMMVAIQEVRGCLAGLRTRRATILSCTSPSRVNATSVDIGAMK